MTKRPERPLISILIPCKNASLYLDECLNSIVNQTYSHWELIIVDDHSTDNSWKILESWHSRYDNIHILPNSESGIISALKLAYSTSKGQLITRMDADDVMTLNKLEIMMSQLIKHGTKHIATGMVAYFRNDQPIGDGYQRYANWLNSLSIKGDNFKDIYKECVIASPCWMLYREDLDAIEAFNLNIYPEDYDLVFRMYENSLKVIPSSREILHLWRDHSDRASRNDPNYKDNRFLDLKIKYFIRLDYRQDKNLYLWGAGKKAKQIAKALIDNGIDFYWLTNNEKKIGHNIYGKILQSTNDLATYNDKQILLTMANSIDQKTVKEKILNLTSGTDNQSFWFC